MPTVIKKLDANSYQLKDQVVSINRVTKVVKGGKNLSFAALVVVGDTSAANDMFLPPFTTLVTRLMATT